LLYSKGGPQYNIWRVPIFTDRPAHWDDAQQVTFEQANLEYIDISPDGQWFLFSSDRSGNQDIWRMAVGGGEIQPITTNPAPDWFPRWSPDGRMIAFYSARSGNRDIWVMPAEGGPAQQLTDHEALDWMPAWSPDGQMVAFHSRRSGNGDIWVVPVEGGEAGLLTDHSAIGNHPEWSPDGKWVYFRSTRSGENRLWRVPPEGGEPEMIAIGPEFIIRPSSDGKRILFLRSGNIWALSLEDGTELQLTDLDGRPGSMRTETLATDGENLYFVWGMDLTDLWVMDVVRE
jgi:Tol biopolymer transport system component